MLRRIVFLVLLLVLAAISWRYRKVLVFSALTAAGRNHPCTVAEVVTTHGHYEMGEAATEYIAQHSRQIKREPGYELWETPYGQFWIPANNTFLALDLGEQRRLIYGTWPDGVRSGDIVLDCGANVGVFVRTALNAGAKMVVAIEPAPENLVCLRRNFHDEIEARRVVIVPKGVYDREGYLTFEQDKTNSAADRFVPGGDAGPGALQLPITRIDTIASELQLTHIDFIKMDIEGSERFALTGANGVMAKHQPRLAICSYHLADDIGAISTVVRKANAKYSMRCGVCRLYYNPMRVGAQVLFFR
jgi:FkbM family methyltransferase